MRNKTTDDLTALVVGTFALPHPGHVSLFRTIKQILPCRLVVGLNADRRTRALKWYAVLDADARAELLRACRWVDDVVVFEEDHPGPLIERLHPDVYIKGYDWYGREAEMPELEVCDRLGIPVVFLRLPRGPLTSIHASNLAVAIANSYLALSVERNECSKECSKANAPDGPRGANTPAY